VSGCRTALQIYKQILTAFPIYKQIPHALEFDQGVDCREIKTDEMDQVACLLITAFWKWPVIIMHGASDWKVEI
jgi:hypothetical protein